MAQVQQHVQAVQQAAAAHQAAAAAAVAVQQQQQAQLRPIGVAHMPVGGLPQSVLGPPVSMALVHGQPMFRPTYIGGNLNVMRPQLNLTPGKLAVC